MKPLETAIFCFITASVVFSCTTFTYRYDWCRDIPDKIDEENRTTLFRGWCGPSQFDPLASHFFTNEGTTIRNILEAKIALTWQQMIIVFVFWYVFTCITYGTFVPAGLFLPGIILGCCIGQLYAEFLSTIGVFNEESYEKGRKALIVIGIASMMAGYTRMTYSLAVVVLETAQIINLFIPCSFSILVANLVGQQLCDGLYQTAIKGKGLPILHETVPSHKKNLIAEKIMTPDPITLKTVETMENIMKALNSGHHAFPLINSVGNVSGMMPRNFIITLLNKKVFYQRAAKDIKTTANFTNEEIDLDFEDGRPKIMSLNQSDNEMLRNSMLSGMRSSTEVGRGDVDRGSVFSNQTYRNYSAFFDKDLFPETPDQKLLDWTHFMTDFYSMDKDYDERIRRIAIENMSEMVDFRPYMIENPVSVMSIDQFQKCLDIFRKMHLRHMLVIHPASYKLVGIITRHDLYVNMK